MHVKSPWLRGLLFGGIAAISVPVALFVFNGIQEWERDLNLIAIGAAFYFNAGFIIGFCTHREASSDIIQEPVVNVRFGNIGQWICRFVGGFALGGYVAALVELLMLMGVIETYGSLDNYLSRQHPQEERHQHFAAFCTALGGMAGGMIAGFFGAMLASLHSTTKATIQSALISGSLGAFAGAFFGGLVGQLQPKYLDSDHAAIVAVLCGAMMGIAAVIVLRR